MGKMKLMDNSTTLQNIAGESPADSFQFMQMHGLPLAQVLGFNPFNKEEVVVGENGVQLLGAQPLTVVQTEGKADGFWVCINGPQLVFGKAQSEDKRKVLLTGDTESWLPLWTKDSTASEDEREKFLQAGSWAPEIAAFLGEQLQNPSKGFLNYLSTTVRKKSLNPEQLEQDQFAARDGMKLFIDAHLPAPEKSWEEQVAAAIEALFPPEMASRLAPRVNRTYTAILLDDNNRKPICRLYKLDSGEISLGLLSGTQEIKREKLENLDGLKPFVVALKTQYGLVAQGADTPPATTEAPASTTVAPTTEAPTTEAPTTEAAVETPAVETEKTPETPAPEVSEAPKTPESQGAEIPE
jgi:hypothetical protein